METEAYGIEAGVGDRDPRRASLIRQDLDLLPREGEPNGLGDRLFGRPAPGDAVGGAAHGTLGVGEDAEDKARIAHRFFDASNIDQVQTQPYEHVAWSMTAL